MFNSNRVGRIAMNPGDDIDLLVQNFCKAYSLDKLCQERLKQIINEKLDNFIQENGHTSGEENVEDKD